MDTPPFGKKFGDVIQDALASYKRGSRVTVIFVSGNPRNDVRAESTFLAVEVSDTKGWNLIATDANWETRFGICLA